MANQFGKLLIGSILYFTSVHGIIFKNLGLDVVVKCPPASIECLCGKYQTVSVIVPQCSYFHRLKTKCKPCNDRKPESVCPKYANCAQCFPDGGDQCLACPVDKFGPWCEYTCTCQNGGQCDVNGQCSCREGFEGTKCERRKGCRAPDFMKPPLISVFNPPNYPMTIVYTCEPGYQLKGATISSCLPDGKWTSPPPQCLAKCPLLSAPASGRLTFGGDDLVEGATAVFDCDPGHRLIGENVLTCRSDGTWSSKLPVCDKLALCPDPGDVQHAIKTVSGEAQIIGATFHQDSTIRYDCKEGFQEMGENSMICMYTGEWSVEKPTCVKAATLIPDCSTSGSDIIAEVGVPVRIFCPPECTSIDHEIWGTSIYRMKSAVCPAAVHAGKITNSGGLVAVINNGEYTSFAGSHINSIQTESFEGTDQSFRFDKLPTLIESKANNKCPKGLIKLQQICALISTYPSPESEAEAICTNLGLTMIWPDSPDDRRRLLILLGSRRIDELWTGIISELDQMTRVIPELDQTNSSEVTTSLNSSLTEVETLFMTPQPRCETMAISGLEFIPKTEDCQVPLHYVCTYSPASRLLASCTDPGALEYGEVQHIGKISEAFYVGSSIEYSCESLHYLKGADKIFCTANGTWSDEKPSCIKVETCGEPPVPYGGFVNYLPPLDSPMAERIAISRSGNPTLRMARLPVGLNAKSEMDALPAATTTPEPEIDIELPPGRHRVGSRAMYECESRYYRLVGSKARRCQAKGEWSGRSPTCIPICGRSDSPRAPFIVNGNATDIGQWPWQAGLARYIPDYNRWFLLCGGSLLSERWIITAAHCVTFAGTNLVIDPDKFRVYLGKYHRSDSNDDEFVQTKKIHEIHIHPDYDPGIFDADIALIQLETPVQLNSRVQPVCLPTVQSTQENLKPGSKGVVTGWGMNENDSYSDTLQQAVVPVVSSDECEKGYEESDLPLTVTDNMFCAGYKEGRYDACSGDSGGPIVFTDESEKPRRWILEGVVSWGSPKGCGNVDQYGGYTTVSNFLDWIHLYF